MHSHVIWIFPGKLKLFLIHKKGLQLHKVIKYNIVGLIFTASFFDSLDLHYTVNQMRKEDWD